MKTYLYFLYLLLFISVSCNNSKKKTENSQKTVLDKKEDLNKLISTKDSIKKETDLIIHKIDTITDTPLDSTNKLQEKKTTLKKIAKSKPKKIKPKKILKPDHSIWNMLTKKYVYTTGKVNYNGFKSNSKLLDSYITKMGKTPPKNDWSKNEKLAYWFNLYNAATIQLIIKSYPIESIKGLNNGKPWDKVFIKSGSKTYSLNQIENKIVRPNFNEPRLHVAFNCAAISCPKLLNEAFIPSKLNSQLTKLSKEWINDASKNKISSNTITISKIFDWYSKDFRKGTIPFINKYSKIKINENATINYLEYNWNLND